MILSIIPIKKDIGAAINIDVAIPAKNIQYMDILDGDNIIVIGSIKNLDGKNYLLEITLKCNIVVPCDRCLAPVSWSMEEDICEKLILSGEDNPNGFDVLYDDSLNIFNIASSYIITKMPMKILCKEACRGLCHNCGINLNDLSCSCMKEDIDSRLAILNDFFNE